MSRVGKLPISIPKDVEIKMDGENIIIKGKYGELLKDIPSPIKIDFNDQFSFKPIHRFPHIKFKCQKKSSTWDLTD